MADRSSYKSSPALQVWLDNQLNTYTLFDALRGRRSRRFGLGMEIPEGPFAYKSLHDAVSLTEDEEALLAFAACGISGYSLADLSYGKGQGGHMLDGLIGRTVGSPDAINTVAVIVTNDSGTYLIRRPQEFAYADIPALLELSRTGKLLDLYRRMRVQLSDQRTTAPVMPGLNFNINKWSLYAKGGTYFLPVNEMTEIYINAVLESFDPAMGLYIVDERNLYRGAGIGRFAKSRGGFLWDDLKAGRVVTVQGIELSLAEAAAVEQGAILQNIGLMAQLLGVGGFPNYARSEYAWLQALNFRLLTMPASRYVGANWFLQLLLKLLGRDFPLPYAVGLERGGQILLHSYAPPYYPTMRDAVIAFVEHKFGPKGIYWAGAATSAWKDPASVSAKIERPSDQAIEATIAYCEYIFKRYGRFPAYSAPFRTVIGYQATHVEVDFYDKFFQPEALTNTQRERHALWEQQR
ncbi:MAG: hypothetical protein ACYDBJ_02090 [Aggregatilineales bacterium]